MTQCHDTRIAKDQIERERKHHHDQDLAAERHAVREHKEGGDRDEPWQGLTRAEAVAPEQIIGRTFARASTVGRGHGVTRGHRNLPA